MVSPEPLEVYRAIPLRPQAPWWRRWRGKNVAACAHAGSDLSVKLRPDEVELRHAGAAYVREPPRPPIEVCPDCLVTLFEQELKSNRLRVVAFEPARDGLAAYRFIEQNHLGDAGLSPEDIIHSQSLVASPLGGCQKCAQPAFMLLVKRGSTTESGKLTTFRGGKEYYCAEHGADRLAGLLRERVPKRRVEYFNFPYGERGLYIPAD